MTDNRIKQIADCNGMEVILNKLTEECGELVTAIARSQTTEFREDATHEQFDEDVVEEAVDVWLMIEQFRQYNKFEFDLMLATKISRQLERMGKKNE